MLPTLVYSTKQTTLQPTLMATESTDIQVQHKTDHPSTHLDGHREYRHTGTAQNRPPFNPPWWPQRVPTYRYSTKQTTLQPILMTTESTDIQVQHRPPFNPPWWPQCIDRQVQHKTDHPSTHLDGHSVLTDRYSTKQTTLQPTLMATVYWQTGTAQNRPPFNPPWWQWSLLTDRYRTK